MKQKNTMGAPMCSHKLMILCHISSMNNNNTHENPSYKSINRPGSFNRGISEPKINHSHSSQHPSSHSHLHYKHHLRPPGPGGGIGKRGVSEPRLKSTHKLKFAERPVILRCPHMTSVNPDLRNRKEIISILKKDLSSNQFNHPHHLKKKKHHAHSHHQLLLSSSPSSSSSSSSSSFINNDINTIVKLEEIKHQRNLNESNMISLANNKQTNSSTIPLISVQQISPTKRFQTVSNKISKLPINVDFDEETSKNTKINAVIQRNKNGKRRKSPPPELNRMLKPAPAKDHRGSSI
mmetsp:Transcript_14174/g.18429  ORF Transcript_14174/g.18429 Transcript_14174/m.18429 type:complete len:293 (-) Transcript_14174:343-1221(-)